MNVSLTRRVVVGGMLGFAGRALLRASRRPIQRGVGHANAGAPTTCLDTFNKKLSDDVRENERSVFV